MSRKKENTLEMDVSSSIENAENLKKQMLDVIKKSDIIHVNIAKLNKVDTSFFQVLMAACLEVHHLKKEIHINGIPTEAFIKTASQAGVLSMREGTIVLFEELKTGGIPIEQ